MTDAELRLWLRLRGEQLDGYRFRRQVPIGPYIVDFLSPKAKIVIEVDGSQHQVEADADGRRSAWLESRGYRVMRFWNGDVLTQTDAVMETIRKELLTPSPALPARGREIRSI